MFTNHTVKHNQGWYWKSPKCFWI